MQKKEIAEKLGVSKSSITHWLAGDNAPDMDVIVKICDMFQINFSTLCTEVIPAFKDSVNEDGSIKKAPDAGEGDRRSENISYITSLIEGMTEEQFKRFLLLSQWARLPEDEFQRIVAIADIVRKPPPKT